MNYTLKQAKRIVLSKHPKAFIEAFSGWQLTDGAEGLALSEQHGYENDFFDRIWIDAANKIMAADNV